MEQQQVMATLLSSCLRLELPDSDVVVAPVPLTPSLQSALPITKARHYPLSILLSSIALEIIIIGKSLQPCRLSYSQAPSTSTVQVYVSVFPENGFS